MASVGPRPTVATVVRVVAAERLEPLKRTALGAGPGLRRAPQMVPAGRVHLIDDGQALCGYVGNLHVVNRAWDSFVGGLGSDIRCDECYSLASETRHLNPVEICAYPGCGQVRDQWVSIRLPESADTEGLVVKTRYGSLDADVPMCGQHGRRFYPIPTPEGLSFRDLGPPASR